MKRIYLDYAATSPVKSEVVKAMLPYFSKFFGNPSSIHSFGRDARAAIGKARIQVAGLLNCSPGEIIFTGGGTESDNLAIFGFARINKNKGNHIITTTIEHHAVEECFRKLEKEGFKATYLGVDHEGLVKLDDLKKAITAKTIFVSIIYTNNEIGTIQNIKEIAKICREKNVVFHTDACQAANYQTIDVEKLGVDLMTLNGSKISGPKGIGVLYKRKGIVIEPVMYGGGQENALRPGTENVAGIVGFAKALELALENRTKENQRLIKLRDYFIDTAMKKIPDVSLNGSRKFRSPNNVNLSFKNVEGESILIHLDLAGIAASSGSACTSGSLEPSHVLLSLGMKHEDAHGSIRFTLGEETTKTEIDYTISQLVRIIKKLREMSPFGRE